MSTDYQLVASQSAAEAKDVLEVVDTIPCETDDDYAAVVAFTREGKTANDKLEEMKQSALAPLRETEKVIRGWFAPAQEAWALVEQKLKQKMLGYHSLQAKRKEEARAALAAAAATGTVEEVKEASVALVQAETPKVEGVVIKKVWDFELEDLGEVPPEYLALNGPAVRRAITMEGVREIPGVRIFQRDQVAVKK